jgi:hypothetical protein
VVFPPQQQFLTKLLVQAMPVLNVSDPANAANPFNEFSKAPSVGGMEVRHHLLRQHTRKQQWVCSTMARSAIVFDCIL